jgi:hypothetical protein
MDVTRTTTIACIFSKEWYILYCVIVALYSLNYIHLDVYSFGVVLFEIFERELPWVNVTNAVVAYNILSGKTLTVRETRK